MTGPRESDRLISAFLDEGLTELPDRTYDAVRDHIDHSRQRALIGPWRAPLMSNLARFAIAAAAVLVVAVIGINLLPRDRGGVGGAPAVTASPSPTPPPASSPTPPPAPSPSPLGATNVGSVLSGPYHVGDPFALPFTVDLVRNQLQSVSAGGVSFAVPNSSQSFGVFVPNGMYADPCKADASPQPVPTTVDGFVGAWDAMVGFNVDSATDVTIDGHAGKAVVLSNTVSGKPACHFGADWVTVFTYAGAPDPQGAATNPGSTEYLWVVEVAGRPVVIATGPQAASFAELSPVVQSLHFDN